MKPAERGKYIYRIAGLLQERAREFAILESMDGGKPIKESRDVDVPLAVAHFFYHAGWADKLRYAFPGRTAAPIGVCGQIIPWNFPLLMAAWKLAPALACGNTVVLKPAETTPLTAMHLAKILQEADLPPGVVNIVPGAGETGAHLVNHPRVKKIAFTGSTEVGKLIQRATAATGKRLTLELGGKAANIVFEDAALDQAVEGIINGIYFNQGHVCCAGSRLLVEESVADTLMQKLGHRIETLRSAIRSTRTPTSGRSTRRRSSRRSRSSSPAVSRKAPRFTRAVARCRRRDTSSRRPGSPVSRNRTASRARRSSDRCSR
jgi:aldehyde dehydrogenase (NAD+)